MPAKRISPRFLPATLLLALLAGCGGEPADAPAATAADPAQAQRAERESLEALQRQVEADRERVAGFVVTAAGYSHDTLGGDQPRPVVDVAMKNGSGLVVARVQVLASFRSEGEDRPWLEQTFDFPVARPMAPGADSSQRLTPDAGTDWATRAPASDVPVTVQVVPVSLETPEGERLLAEGAFGPAQARRLRELKATGH